MKQFWKLYVPQVWQRMALFIGALAVVSMVHAQKIDLDQAGRNTAEVTATNFSSWMVNQLSYNQSESKSFGNVNITVRNSTNGYSIRTSWYKAAISSDKLINDGIHFDGSPRSATSITIQVSGLSNTSHTLQAYHNNTDAVSGMGSVSVAVNGQHQAAVNQTIRAASTAEAAKTFVTFYGSSVTLTYTCSTDFYINSLEFDVDNADAMAKSPIPADNDLHANADGGNITLGWGIAQQGADSQVLYWGDNKNNVTNGNCNHVNLNGWTTSYNLSGVSPLKTYYWRVDEVKNGITTKGTVWTFQPRRLAFPGAEGYGKWAIGGRGGQVYHVTNLNDDGSYGSFRYGVTQLSGPRTIVFDVSGVITLNDRLTINDPYITIAGQTAPGRGIMFRNKALGVASDGITRFIRLRLGGGDSWSGSGPNQATMDGMGASGNNHSILDHCSISWAIDEGFSSRNARNLTLQRTLISEELNYAGHSHYVEANGTYVEHGYAATIGGGIPDGAGSFHHNLLAHNNGRNWSMAGGLIDGNYAGYLDIFNNVVYNWGSRTTDGGTHQCNFVNNYYKMGPASTENYLLTAELEGAGNGTQSYYVNGNIRENLNGSKTTNQEELRRQRVTNGQVVNWQVFVNNPFFDSQANIESAEASFKNVLSDVGCNQPEIDNHDARMVSETLNRTTSTQGYYTHKQGLIDRESDAEGFAGLNIITESRPSNWDTDQDGMPDWWESAYGTNPNVADNNGDLSGNNYTNLEEYLNWLAEPHFIIDVEGTIDLNNYFAGYTNPTYSISYVTNGAIANLNGASLVVDRDAAPALFQVIVTANQDGVSLARTFNFYSERTNAGQQTQQPTTEDCTITWAFNQGTANQQPTLSSNLEGKVMTNVAIGSNLTYGGTRDLSTYTGTRIGVKVNNEGNPNNNNKLTFTITPMDGYELSITRVEFTASRIGTDGGYVDVSWGGNKIAQRLRPCRNNYNPDYTTYTYDVDPGDVTSAKELALNLYALGITKQYVFGNIKFYGTITEVEAPQMQTLTSDGVIQWTFNQGTANQQATLESDFVDRVNTSVSIGSGLKYSGVRVLNYFTETCIGVNVNNEPNPNNNNKLTFNVAPVDGCELAINRIEFTATRIGTDGGYIDVSWDGNKIAQRLRPARNNGNPQYTTYSYNVNPGDTHSGHNLSLNIYSLGITKQYGFANIKIYGTLTYTVPVGAKKAFMDDEVTDINCPENEALMEKQDVWYTLQGVRIDKPTTRGIYIHNGKKVLVR